MSSVPSAKARYSAKPELRSANSPLATLASRLGTGWVASVNGAQTATTADRMASKAQANPRVAVMDGDDRPGAMLIIMPSTHPVTNATAPAMSSSRPGLLSTGSTRSSASGWRCPCSSCHAILPSCPHIAASTLARRLERVVRAACAPHRSAGGRSDSWCGQLTGRGTCSRRARVRLPLASGVGVRGPVRHVLPQPSVWSYLAGVRVGSVAAGLGGPDLYDGEVRLQPCWTRARSARASSPRASPPARPWFRRLAQVDLRRPDGPGLLSTRP